MADTDRLPEATPARRYARWALALVFVAAGANHFINPDFYVGIMPPWLPWHLELVWVSGFFEILGGVGVLVERWRSAAGWGLVLLLLAVFPANLHMALNPELFPDIPGWALWLRLPLQPLFILWAWWASRPTRDPDGGRRAGASAAVTVVAGLGLLATAGPATAQELSWRPSTPVQGRLFTLRVEGQGAGIVAVEGEVEGEPLHFARVGEGAWESPAPVPIDTEGALALTLRVHRTDGGESTLSGTVPIAAGSYRHERLTVAPRLGGRLSDADAARLREDQRKAAEVARRAHATPPMWTTPMVMPRDDRVTSGFGNGRVFNGQVSSRHMGLDLDGDPGAVVVAPTRGVVALVDSFLLAGDIVYLVHGGGLLSGYFHLSEQLVAPGDTVEAGTPIGRVGATGRVTGPHLHWVVRYGTTSVDPRSLLELR